jgi:hypothetical protein
MDHKNTFNFEVVMSWNIVTYKLERKLYQWDLISVGKHQLPISTWLCHKAILLEFMNRVPSSINLAHWTNNDPS